MSNNTTNNDVNGTDNQHGGYACGPPPGWTGPPPPGSYANTADTLMRVIPPVLILLGAFGNSLTLIVLLRQMRKLSSTAIFLLTLAVSDTMFLLTGPLRRWIIAVWEEDIRHRSEVGCKVSVYLTYCSSQYSSWVLVAVTVERLISVVWPHRVRLGCTPRLSRASVIILFCIIFGLNTHIFYGFGRSDLPVYRGLGYCEPIYENYRLFWEKTYAWIDLCVVYAFPFGILVVANSVIIYKLDKTRVERQTMTASGKSTASDTRSVTIMLIVLSVIFFLSLTPVSIYFIYRPYWEEENVKWLCVDVYEYIRLSEIQHFVFILTNLFGYVNASFNFVLYIISGSKYRSEIKALFLCRPSGKTGVFGHHSTGSQRRTVYSTVSAITKASEKTRDSLSDSEPFKDTNESETGTSKKAEDNNTDLEMKCS